MATSSEIECALLSNRYIGPVELMSRHHSAIFARAHKALVHRHSAMESVEREAFDRQGRDRMMRDLEQGE